MLLADVVTGAYATGRRGMRTPPINRGIDLFDSVVDDEFAPSIFVVFKDASAYPKYLIKYK